MTVTAIAPGVYRVSESGRTWTVAVAGPREDRWVWIDGEVHRLESAAAEPRRRRRAGGASDLTSPMPATVVRVLAAPGAAVKRGDTLLMLEAMKMELPIRAPRDGVVSAVHCRPGELVQPGVGLIDLE